MSNNVRQEKQVTREIILSKQMVVTQDQAIRYADASGDDNPVHLDKEMAQAAGLLDIFLQGLCTLAFATQAVVDELVDGDPTRVIKVKTRFSKPVYMLDILTTQAWMIEETDMTKKIGFETKNQDGLPVLTLGEIELKK
ncbi:MAG: MaoC/PaaZ C-terminal domain-containing protein [Candidatus Hodarchaeales archaeon]